MRSRAAGYGDISTLCVPQRPTVAIISLHASQKWPRAGKSAPSWQHIAAMHPKRADVGKICAPCVRKALQIAFRECTARRSCQGGALFAALTSRITHGAQILPQFSARKVLRAEGWRRWVVASALCIEADGPPCSRTPVAATSFGERTVRRRVCLPEQRPSCVRPQQPSPPPLFGSRAPTAAACPGAAHLTARLASQLMLRRTDGAGVPIPRQPPNPWRVPFRNRPPHGTSCPPQLSIRAPLVGSGFPRRSAQKSDQLNAGRFGSLSLWQFANYAQIIQRVPSGDDQARRPADGA